MLSFSCVYIRRINGFNSAATVKNLTSSKLVKLEQSMQSFPCQIVEHADANNIKLTKEEKRRIFYCFKDSMMSISAEDFGNYTIRPSDKKQILYIAEYIRAKISSTSVAEYSFSFECYNPNAKLSTISTIVGSFHGSELSCPTKNSIAFINGMYYGIITI